MLLLLNSWVMLAIKPYVLVTFAVSAIIFLYLHYLVLIKNKLLKILFVPILAILFSFSGLYIYGLLSDSLGSYGSLKSATTKAKVTQEDLLRSESYGNNNYNLGKIDGTITNMLSLAPVAIFTAIFRPFPWEVGSPTMVFSSIENIILYYIFNLFIDKY